MFLGFFLRYFFGVILIATFMVSPLTTNSSPLEPSLNTQIRTQKIDTTNPKILATKQLIISAKIPSLGNLSKIQNLNLTNKLNITKTRELHPSKIFKIAFTQDINSSLISLLETQEWVSTVALNPIESTQSLIQDPYISTYPTNIINQNYANLLDRLQPLVKSNPTIAVIDSAFDSEQVDLSGNILSGIDFADGDMDVNLPSVYKTATSELNIANRSLFHGSMVAGVIIASANNSGGVGVCPWCKVKPYKTSSDDDISINSAGIYQAPGLYQDSMIASIYHAISRGIKIINISAGSKIYSSVYQEVVDYARDHGVIIVASSGNDNNNEPLWPASFDSVISVASINTNLTKSSYSSYGPSIDISVPVDSGLVAPVYRNNQGQDIWTPRALGTSFAAPVVSGVIGLITSLNPIITYPQLKALLTNPLLLTNLNLANPSMVNQLGLGLNPETFLTSFSFGGLDEVSSNITYNPSRVNLPRYNSSDLVTINLNNIQTQGLNPSINWICQLFIKDYYSQNWRAVGNVQYYNPASGCQYNLTGFERSNIAYLNIKWQLNNPTQSGQINNSFEFEDLLVFDFNGVGRSS